MRQLTKFEWLDGYVKESSLDANSILVILKV